MISRISCIALVFVIQFSSYVVAGEPVIRSYTLPDHGKLIVVVPDTWDDQLRQPPSLLPPTISFRGKSGSQFQVLVTPMWPMEGVPKLSSGEIREKVRQAADNAARQATQDRIDVKKLSTKHGDGYYFSATDRAPKPGEYKHMTQGMIPLGDMSVMFTVLTNDGQSSVIETALEIVADIKHQK